MRRQQYRVKPIRSKIRPTSSSSSIPAIDSENSCHLCAITFPQLKHLTGMIISPPIYKYTDCRICNQLMDQSKAQDDIIQIDPSLEVGNCLQQPIDPQTQLVLLERQLYIKFIMLGKSVDKARIQYLRQQMRRQLNHLKTIRPYYNYISSRNQSIKLSEFQQQIQQKCQQSMKNAEELGDKIKQLEQDKDLLEKQIQSSKQAQQIQKDIQGLDINMKQLRNIGQRILNYKRDRKIELDKNTDSIVLIKDLCEEESQAISSDIERMRQRIDVLERDVVTAEKNIDLLNREYAEVREQDSHLSKIHEEHKLRNLNGYNTVRNLHSLQSSFMPEPVRDELCRREPEVEGWKVQTCRREDTLRTWMSRNYIFWLLGELIVIVILIL